jgi:hypothetical protein
VSGRPADAGLVLARAAYLLLPLLCGALAGGVVLRFGLWPGLRRPIDGGWCVRGRRLFGDNKTWLMVWTGVIGCTAGVLLQKYVLRDLARPLAVIDYARVSAVSLGVALGAAVSAGELPNSFVKRQLGIPPGHPGPRGWRWLTAVCDQVDVLICVWPVLLLWVRPSLGLVAASFLVVLVVHPLVTLVGWWIGVRARPR